MQNLKKLIALTEHKQKIDLKRGEAKYMDTNFLLDSITDEVEEVREEIKPNNLAHLEDELGDILWGWLILVEKLKEREFIGSHEDIFKRTLKKYEERILPLNGDKNDHKIWKEVKAKQKIMLEEMRCLK